MIVVEDIMRKILGSSNDTFICHFEINMTNNIAYYNIYITKQMSGNCYRNWNLKNFRLEQFEEITCE